jgi:hypothetical protein
MWVFFRDDDLGWEPKAFARLLTTFAKNDQRLNAAAIPSLLSDEIIGESIPYSHQASPFLQVVVHGYAHENHQKEGKKCEFGADRSEDSVAQELGLGLKKIQSTFENSFPCFVPPWNRMADRHLPLLRSAGFKVLSREAEVSKKSARPQGIIEADIDLDLHTRKDGHRLSAAQIFRQLALWNEEGKNSAGIMLHHNRMTDSDFLEMDTLLKELSKRNIQTVFFSDMVPGSERRSELESFHV